MTPNVLADPEPVALSEPPSPSSLVASALPPVTIAGPVPPDERNAALDTLRGIAVLGILLMNILTFGLPAAAAANPNAAGGADGLNIVFWFANQVFFDGKMRCLFSMMFGAGMLMLTERIGRAGADSAADVYYRRILWLIVFGLLHAYLLWYGDVLYWYGIIGLALFPLRKVRPVWLLFAGFLLASTHIPKAIMADSEVKEAATKAREARTAKDDGNELTEEQRGAITAWEAMREGFAPSRDSIDKEIAKHKACYVEQFKERAKVVENMQSSVIYRWGLSDVASMMLIGMGLYKLGILTGARSRRFYWFLVTFGYGIGIPLNGAVGMNHIQNDFDPARVSAIGMASFNYGRLLVALGHIGAVMLICDSGRFGFFTRRLAAVGRMPLTNYLFETVACVLIFEGYGLGLFGSLQLYELLFVVLGVWAIQLTLSPVWLRFIRYGPAEWVWRALAYWKCPALLARSSHTT